MTMINFIKKYWKIVAGFLLAVVSFLLFKKKQPSVILPQIKTLENQEKTIVSDRKQAEAKKEQIKTEIKDTSSKIEELKKEKGNIDSKVADEAAKKSTQEKVNYLKNISKISKSN